MRTALALPILLVILAAGCGGDDQSSSNEQTSANASDGSSSSGGLSPTAAPMGPGLTIAQALESDLDGPLLVRGWLIAVGDDVRLCEAIAESSPPQCAGASLRIEDVAIGALGDLEQASDVSWSREVMKLLGRVEGDELLLDETSNG